MSSLAVPPIPLHKLPEQTKDYLLALSNERECTPVEAVKQTLDAAAASFMPPAVEEKAEGRAE